VGINILGRPLWKSYKRFALYYRTVVCPVCPDLSVLSCLSVTLVYYGQTVGWIKMPLSTEVGLIPGHIVLDGDAALSPKGGGAQPLIWPISIVAKWLDG